MKKLLDGRVAIVTGAGGGLGRADALELARHGARVVVNDVAGADDGAAAGAVVAEIAAQGGEARAWLADVTRYAEVEAMAGEVAAVWGRIDILVNNAGILRDKSFAKMTIDDFRLVADVHLMGGGHRLQGGVGPMREQRYGRIVMTASSSGLYGNFGQATTARPRGRWRA